MTAGMRGSSEVIGFLLVFSVIVTSVGLVQSAGYDSVSELHDREQNANAEQTFMALAAPLDRSRSHQVARTVTMRLGDGRLALENGPQVLMEINGSTSTIDTGLLVYRTGSIRMTYASGGVFRGTVDNDTLLREPDLACRPPDVAVVSIAMYRSELRSVDSDGPVNIGVRPVDTDVWRVDRVQIDLSDSAHGHAWARYFRQNGWNASSPGYSCTADHIVVRRTTFQVRFVM